MKKLTLDDVRKRISSKYKNFNIVSDYYFNNRTKLSVQCNICGVIFSSTAQQLLSKSYNIHCPNCIKKEYENNVHLKRYKSNYDFLQELSKYVDLNLFDFSNFVYNGIRNITELKCKKHDIITITPFNLLSYYKNNDYKKYSICKECLKEYHKEYLKKKYSTLIHDNFKNIDCSYIDIDLEQDIPMSKRKIILKCEEHGKFEISIGNCFTTYVNKKINPCQLCRGKKRCNITTEKFISDLNIIYYDKGYDFSKVEYLNSKSKVILSCPVHGEFLRTPYRLYEGRGCPYCKESLLERKLRIFFEKENIDFIYQYRNKKILGRKSLDFFIPQLNIGIECQGRQHLFNDSIFHDKETLSEIKSRDNEKYNICQKNGIMIIYFSQYKLNEYINNSFSNLNDLLEFIKKYAITKGVDIFNKK